MEPVPLEFRTLVLYFGIWCYGFESNNGAVVVIGRKFEVLVRNFEIVIDPYGLNYMEVYAELNVYFCLSYCNKKEREYTYFSYYYNIRTKVDHYSQLSVMRVYIISKVMFKFQRMNPCHIESSHIPS